MKDIIDDLDEMTKLDRFLAQHDGNNRNIEIMKHLFKERESK